MITRCTGEKYIAVEGVDKAVELAKVIAKNGYQVCFYEDDCDIWIVSWADTIDGSGFVELTEDEQIELEDKRNGVETAQNDEDYEESNKDSPWYEDKDEDAQ